MKNLISYFDLSSFLGITIYSICVLIVYSLFSKIFRSLFIYFLKKRFTKEKFGETRLKFIKNSLRFIFGLIGVLIILFTVPIFRKQVGYIFSGAGILAAIVGFAAKDAISNLIAGLFIVLFRPFRIGDYIKLENENTGIVDDITLRHTVINTFENKRLIIPNSVISTESVLNYTIQDNKILSTHEFIISSDSDLELAKIIISQEAKKLNFVIDNRTPQEIVNNEPEFIIRLVNILDSAYYLNAYIWISNPLKEFHVKSLFKENVNKRFIEEGICLPIKKIKIIT